MTHSATRTYPKPPDRRPYVRMSESGHEIRTVSTDGTTAHRWRQVAWQGQTGALYGLHEQPGDYEPGSFSPLYAMVDSDPWDPPETP
jgi:hypothetical protein